MSENQNKLQSAVNEGVESAEQGAEKLLDPSHTSGQQAEKAGMGDKVRDAAGKAKNALGDSYNQVTEKSREYVDKGREYAEKGYQQVADKTREYADRGREFAHQGYEMAGQWEQSLEEKIRQRPLASVLIAAGVGIVAGMLISHRSDD